jgi:hypothetical protein
MPKSNNYVLWVTDEDHKSTFLESAMMGGDCTLTIHVERAWIINPEKARSLARSLSKSNPGHTVRAMPYEEALKYFSYCVKHWPQPGVYKSNCGHCDSEVI